MNKEINNIVKKSAKIAGVTCIAAGAVALMTSATAIKALTEGAKYLKGTVEKIIRDDSVPEKTVVEATAEEIVAAPVAEAVAEEADFAKTEPAEVVVNEGNA